LNFDAISLALDPHDLKHRENHLLMSTGSRSSVFFLNIA
jgi:hypothetical protein